MIRLILSADRLGKVSHVTEFAEENLQRQLISLLIIIKIDEISSKR